MEIEIGTIALHLRLSGGIPELVVAEKQRTAVQRRVGHIGSDHLTRLIMKGTVIEVHDNRLRVDGHVIHRERRNRRRHPDDVRAVGLDGRSSDKAETQHHLSHHRHNR